MISKYKLLIQKYFEQHSFIESNIQSFNDFIDWRLQRLINQIGEAVPAVIPPDTEEVKFKFGKIIIKKPIIINEIRLEASAKTFIGSSS